MSRASRRAPSRTSSVAAGVGMARSPRVVAVAWDPTGRARRTDSPLPPATCSCWRWPWWPCRPRPRSSRGPTRPTLAIAFWRNALEPPDPRALVAGPPRRAGGLARPVARPIGACRGSPGRSSPPTSPRGSRACRTRRWRRRWRSWPPSRCGRRSSPATAASRSGAAPGSGIGLALAGTLAAHRRRPVDLRPGAVRRPPRAGRRHAGRGLRHRGRRGAAARVDGRLRAGLLRHRGRRCCSRCAWRRARC